MKTLTDELMALVLRMRGERYHVEGDASRVRELCREIGRMSGTCAADVFSMAHQAVTNAEAA